MSHSFHRTSQRSIFGNISISTKQGRQQKATAVAAGFSIGLTFNSRNEKTGKSQTEINILKSYYPVFPGERTEGVQQLKKTFGRLKELPGTGEEMAATPKWALGGSFQMPMVKSLAAISAQKKNQHTSA